MFRKILYPTDFSAGSEKAIAYLIQLTEAGTEEVVILHVVDTRSLHIPEVFPITQLSTLGAKQVAVARRRAQKLARRLQGHGIKTVVRIEKGVPFKEILKAETEEDVSLIVIGSHGISNIKEMLLGSVAEKVIRKAVKPVLVVKTDRNGRT
jgi:nucleotide-binding universal stress UspA family protein